MHLILTVLLGAFVAISSIGPLPQEGRTLVIDGSKNPELFPEWFVWERTFETLGANSTKRFVPLQDEIGITTTDLTVLKEHVRAFQEAKVIMARRLVAARSAASAKSQREDDINAATEPVILEYRYKVLDLHQHVQERLSAKSVEHLDAWINELMKGTTVRLRGRATEFFRQPR